MRIFWGCNFIFGVGEVAGGFVGLICEISVGVVEIVMEDFL